MKVTIDSYSIIITIKILSYLTAYFIIEINMLVYFLHHTYIRKVAVLSNH